MIVAPTLKEKESRKAVSAMEYGSSTGKNATLNVTSISIRTGKWSDWKESWNKNFMNF